MRAGRFFAWMFTVALVVVLQSGSAAASTKHGHAAVIKGETAAQTAASKPKSAVSGQQARATQRRAAVKSIRRQVSKGQVVRQAENRSATRVSRRAERRKMARAAAARASRASAQMATHNRTAVFAKPEPEFDHEGMPALRSSAFLIQDVQSGKVLLEKNAGVPQPIASITKLMTAMVVLDAHQNLGEVLEVTQEDVDTLKGTSSRLAVGTRLTREELMILALMSSENRAASALSRNYPGGLNAFIQAMNVKTKMMGMNDTHFYDASGLNKNNVSSARDLATMVANASRYPLIRDFSTRKEYTATLAGGRSRTFRNTNALVKDSDWQIDVQKTGYINESGKCLVMQAWLSHKQVAIVLLDSWGRYTRIGDANRVRKWVETSLARRDMAAAGRGAEKLAAN